MGGFGVCLVGGKYEKRDIKIKKNKKVSPTRIFSFLWKNKKKWTVNASHQKNNWLSTNENWLFFLFQRWQSIVFAKTINCLKKTINSLLKTFFFFLFLFLFFPYFSETQNSYFYYPILFLTYFYSLYYSLLFLFILFLTYLFSSYEDTVK